MPEPKKTMSQIINDVATIEISNETMQQLDLGGIYQSFSNNYKKLDNLKAFRSDYEKQNRLARWWHNDKLRDAQLDSSEVQAEFSKTIGQLMMLSIMQSKKLSEQQISLNEQQHKLEAQANGIAEHAATLQEQHHTLAEQSSKLKTLVEEYFELKGLTEDGAQKLVAIARDIKATKASMVQHVDERTQALEIQCSDVAAQIAALGEHNATQMATNSQFESGLSRLSANHEESAAQHRADIAGLRVRAKEIADGLSTSARELADCAQQQQAMHLAVEGLRGRMATHVRRTGYIASVLAAIAIATLASVAHQLR